ncbi:MAG: Na+/H+ antiporter NhaA, partial [Gammaproteobacteria bacterium]
AIKLRIGKLPTGSSWLELYGVAALCGIGFTMSLFISGLAAEQIGLGGVADDRLGILLGSVVSAGIGYFTLSIASRRRRA